MSPTDNRSAQLEKTRSPHRKPHLVAPAETADIEQELGRRLEEVHAELLNEPVPERFRELLTELLEEAKNDKS